MREFIDLLDEAALTHAELIRRDRPYLKLLIQYIGNELPLQVDPKYVNKYGTNVQLDPSLAPVLQQALDSDDIKLHLPKTATAIINGAKVEIPWGAIFKSTEFTGYEGKKDYNAGHLAELIMGLCITAKFLNLGADITLDQLKAMIGYVQSGVSGNNYQFKYSGNINYPEATAKNDSMNFIAVVPTRSAEAFIKQASSGNFEHDLHSVLASAVRYCNESEGVANACQRVRKDKNSNTIEVISDGTSDAKGTKADIQLKVDGTKVNLLSLKTFSSDTLGQISGMSYEQVNKWFGVAFGIDISQYRSLLDETLPKDTIYKNLLTVIYDQVVYPQVEKMVNDQSPGKEAAIVKQLAHAAKYHSRGESLENVEVVKLDDSIKEGNYKILRFSDSLHEAMEQFDLETRYLHEGNSRTIQIWVKPAKGEKTVKGANRLCQFRTTKMGGYPRNYFEIGPMMESLTRVETRAAGVAQPMKAAGASLSADRVKRPGKLKFQEPTQAPVMRAKRA